MTQKNSKICICNHTTQFHGQNLRLNLVICFKQNLQAQNKSQKQTGPHVLYVHVPHVGTRFAANYTVLQAQRGSS